MSELTSKEIVAKLRVRFDASGQWNSKQTWARAHTESLFFEIDRLLGQLEAAEQHVKILQEQRAGFEPRTDDGAAHANHASSPVGCATDAMGLHGNSRRQPEDFPSLAGDERPAAASSSPPPPDELLTAARDVVSIVRKTHDSEKWFTALAVLMRVVDERSTATKEV